MRNWWFVTVLGLALIMAVPSDSFAQKRGGSRSRSRSRATPRRSAPKPARSKAAKPSRGKAGGRASKGRGSFGSSKKKAGKSKKVTKEDQRAYDRAKASGKTAPNRQAAMTKFSKDPANAKKYTSSYASQPATRPGHIPQTTVVGGTQTTIIYNQAGGGYGHWGGGGPGLGTFIMYNAMADMAMRPYYNRQMASAGYMYGPRPVVRTSIVGPVIIVLLVVAVVLLVALPRMGKKSVGS